jgi:hypothetical protein
VVGHYERLEAIYCTPSKGTHGRTEQPPLKVIDTCTRLPVPQENPALVDRLFMIAWNGSSIHTSDPISSDDVLLLYPAAPQLLYSHSEAASDILTCRTMDRVRSL